MWQNTEKTIKNVTVQLSRWSQNRLLHRLLPSAAVRWLSSSRLLDVIPHPVCETGGCPPRMMAIRMVIVLNIEIVRVGEIYFSVRIGRFNRGENALNRGEIYSQIIGNTRTEYITIPQLPASSA